MKQKEKVQQLNKNAGFSLLELLIAVTILAIITIPMLHMFVTSARINGKSRITLRATVLAQDIVEGLKAYHIDEIQDQFNGVEDFEMLNTSVIAGDCTYKEDVDREIAENGSDPDDSSKAKPGKYYFVLKNAKLENSRFDVLISVDATGYMEGASPTRFPLNVKDVAKVTSTEKNSGYTQKKQWIDSMHEEILKEIQDPNNLGIPKTAQDFNIAGLSYKRTINIKLYDDGTFTDDEGNTITKTNATIYYVYEFSYGGKSYTYSYPSAGDPNPCGNFEGNNFYLFYYPLYGAESDKIVFECKQSKALNLYIAKQVDETMSDSELNAAENAYKAVVNIEDPSKDHFTIRTNLGTNIVNDTFLESIHGNAKVPGQVTYQQNGATMVNKLDIFDLGGIRDKEHGADGDNDAITEFIYDIIVEVYEQGAADTGFPADMRKVTFDGTKNH